MDKLPLDEIILGDCLEVMPTLDRRVGELLYHFPTCDCNGATDYGIALDPFSGAGTVATVAKRLKRHYIGIELSEQYCEMARRRVAATQEPMF
ncbi:MAG: DNA methyltransferase [Dehalococcoidia bacterium]